jgi:hypothetical protein
MPLTSQLWSRITASDPGLLRLLLAARGTLSVLLTTLVCMLAAHLLGKPVILFTAGLILSMLGPFFMREPSWQQRVITLLMLTIPAVGVAVATAFLDGDGRAGQVFFLLLVFVSYLLQGRSRRALGLGLTAVVAAYVGLYLQLAPSSLPLQMLSIVIALPVVIITGLVLLPLHPARALRRAVRAVHRRAAWVLSAAQDIRKGDPGAPARLQRRLSALNETALAADDILLLVEGREREAVRIELINLELAVAWAIDALREAGTAAPGEGGHWSHLALTEQRLRHGRWHDETSTTPDHADTPRSALAEVGRAAVALGHAAAKLRPAALSVAPPPPAGPYAWVPAARVTLASALAIVGGAALSPNRWFWAVITTYVVFLGARSRGDAILRGAQRLGGTLLGLVGGIALAWLLDGTTAGQATIALLAVFGLYYTFTISYTLAMVCVTVLLGMLYGMLGAPLLPLLILRVEETAIGAVAAVLVAMFILPARTRDQVSRSSTAAIQALAGVVASSRAALAGGPATPLVAMRTMDRQLADLRLALLPLTLGRSLLRSSEAARPLSSLLTCVRWARLLASASRPMADDQARATLLARADRLEQRIAALAITPRDPTQLAIRIPTAEAAEGHAALAMSELERATNELAERLAVSTLGGFPLE